MAKGWGRFVGVRGPEVGGFIKDRNCFMSLNTILKIRKVLRKSKSSLMHFKYVEQCPVQKDKQGNTIYPLCISIPVKSDFIFTGIK